MKKHIAKTGILVAFGSFLILAAPLTGRADDACAGVGNGPFILKSHGRSFIAKYETYTTSISFKPDTDGVEISSDWGEDWKYTIDSKAHATNFITSTSFMPLSYDFLAAKKPGFYADFIELLGKRLRALKGLVITAETSEESRKALACAIDKVGKEQSYAKSLQAEYDRKIEDLHGAKAVASAPAQAAGQNQPVATARATQ